MLYDTFCEEDDWSYDDGVKYIQENIDLEYLMNQFDKGEKEKFGMFVMLMTYQRFSFIRKPEEIIQKLLWQGKILI